MHCAIGHEHVQDTRHTANPTWLPIRDIRQAALSIMPQPNARQLDCQALAWQMASMPMHASASPELYAKGYALG